jgi:cytochrome c-type biogenesis protein
VLVTAISGAILIVMGLLIVSGQLAVLNAKAQHGLSDLGLDFIYNF